MSSVLDTVDLSRTPTRLLIGGEWCESASGKRFATLNPATEEVLLEVAEAGAAEVDAAVDAAQAALRKGPWATMTGAERGRILHRLAALMRERSEELVLLESIDAGKPLAATRRMDLPAAIDCLEYYAGWADKITGEVVPTRRDALTYIHRVPVGVVGAIVPWNFPLMNAVWKVAPALACGCTVVLKPAELTPLSALWLGRAAIEAGLPAGVLNIVPGFGAGAGAALVSHPDIDKIAFTGSPQTGQFIMRAAAEHITHIGLELGGKSPCVVFADADLEAAIRQTSSGSFFNAGQVCSAATRVIVEDSIHDAFVEGLAKRAKTLRLGNPLDSATTMGPVISQRQMERILGYIDAGRKEGAQAVCGGHRVGNAGYFIEPTVFAGVGKTMKIAQEEIFGPVVSVMRFSDEEQALNLANGTAYSLAAAVWTRNIDRGHRMSHQLNAGTVWVNTYGPTDTRLPWGGMGGQSGIGRDLGRAAIDNYTEQKTVWLQTRA
ncbi:MAG: aldehyde dehydrogenase family protein [Rhizobiales bacterium]|jgi:aldehyde dehydrogenase (NAD+)|nr:aldehyde dehydrogenase family protein [Hyphomicrobiales bacterium]